MLVEGCCQCDADPVYIADVPCLRAALLLNDAWIVDARKRLLRVAKGQRTTRR